MTGQGISDLYTGLTGGVATQTPTAIAGMTPTFVAGVDTGQAAYDIYGNLQLPRWTTFVVGLEYYLPRVGGRVGLFANVSRSQLHDPQLYGNGAKIRDNEMFYNGGFFVDIIEAVRVGVDYGRFDDQYADGVHADQRRGAAHRFPFFLGAQLTPSDSMLAGKVALITGSTSGIGLGIAHALAKQGVHVMLNGFTDEATVAALKKELGALGVKVDFNPCDVTKSEQVDAMIEATVRSLGGLDILVNNAGIQHVAPVEQFPLEKWDAVIATNLSSAFYGMRRAVPLLRTKGWGRIINTASTHGLVGSANKIAYVAAKHGVIGMTKVVALELAGSGVTCTPFARAGC